MGAKTLFIPWDHPDLQAEPPRVVSRARVQNSLRDEKIEDLQAERTFLAPHGVAKVTRCGTSRRQARIPVAVCSGRRGRCATFASAAATHETLGVCRRWSLGRKAPDSNRNRWLSGHFPLLAGLPSVHDSSRGLAINDPGGARVRACSQESGEGAGEAAEASTRGSEKRLQLLNLQPLRPPPRRVLRDRPRGLLASIGADAKGREG